MYHELRICLQAGSSIKRQIPSESNVHAVLESFRLWIFARVKCAPAEPLTSVCVCVFFFPPDNGFLHFWGYLGLKGSHICSQKEKEKAHSSNAGQGHIKHVCVQKNQGSPRERFLMLGTFPAGMIPVTMETRCFHKKLEFQRYPPKDICTARYERKSSKKRFQTF